MCRGHQLLTKSPSLPPSADSRPTDKTQRRNREEAPFVHSPERDQPAPAQSRKRCRPHSRNGFPAGMAGCRKQWREEDEPGPSKQGLAELPSVVHPCRYSGLFGDQHQFALTCEIAKPAIVHRRWLQEEEAATVRKPPRGIDRPLADDEPLVGDALAAGHGRSYSAAK